MAGKFFVYEGIKRELKAQIERGELAEGTRVPSEYELARRFGVSRNQTRQALRELELEGFIFRKRGSGSYVARTEDRVVRAVADRDTTVALVFPRYLSGYCRDVVDGFMQHIAQAGFQTIAYNVQFDEDSEARSLKAIAESGVSGLAVWVEHNNETCRNLMKSLCRRGFPIVLVDRYLPGVDADSVISDELKIGYLLTKALIERGHRRIAFIGSRRGNPTSMADRARGYRTALEEAGIKLDERLMTIRERVYEEPAVVTAELMGLYDRPSAIFCLHDFVALIIYGELVRMGYKIPDHVELAAVEEQHPEKHNHVPVVALCQRGFEVGTKSAELLLARLSNPTAPAQRCAIEPMEVYVHDGGAIEGLQKRDEPPVKGGGNRIEKSLAVK